MADNNELLKNLLAKNIARSTPDNPVNEAKTKVTTTVTVTKPDETGQRKEQTIKDEKTVVERKFFRAKLGYISYESGATISLGNYNMGKVSVNMMIPIGIEITEEYRKQMEDAFAFAKEFVDTKAAAEVSELMKMRQQ
jgi:hypothetical protein